MRWAGALLASALLACVARPAWAETNRFAIIVGSNQGDRDEVILRYAESDAQRMAQVLRAVGGFRAENIIELAGAQAHEVRRALIGLNARVRELAGESLVFVFYSGHADADALHLAGSRLAMGELRDLVTGSPASMRVLVLDACRSGMITRVKGGRPAPAFEVQLDYPLGAHGLAMLSSSAAGESSQESDRLGGSFFSHAFISALLGAGDANRDGVVTLVEAFAYAKERTLAATARTVLGPQHPTFRFDLGGREDLALTRPLTEQRNFGSLDFPRAGFYVVHKNSAEGALVAEVAADDGGRRLALEAGRYYVIRRDPDHFEQGRFDVAAHTVTPVIASSMVRLEYARVVRKGGAVRSTAGSVFVDGGVRGDLASTGTSWRTDAGGRLDLRQISLELRVGFGIADHSNADTRNETRELAFGFGVLRAFDLGPVTLSLGLETGVSAFFQDVYGPKSEHSLSAGYFLGALAQLEVPLPHRFFFRVEPGALVYVLRLQDTAQAPSGQGQSGQSQPGLQSPITYRITGGLGMYF